MAQVGAIQRCAHRAEVYISAGGLRHHRFRMDRSTAIIVPILVLIAAIVCVLLALTIVLDFDLVV